MITISSLVKRHGDLAVLNGVSMTVGRGEVVAIIGPSGGGKSTLLRCINGLERFQGGEIQVDAIKLSSNPDGEALRRLRQRVGMVFQQFNLFPHLSVLENVMAGPRIVLRQTREQAEPGALQLLDRVGLKDKAAARPEQLSGGQQQRVAIARALAVKPEAILFDEPTSALDPRMANEVLAVIADLAHQQQTMLVVTHAMGFARQVANTVQVMADGKVAECGPPEQVFDAPREEVTRRFLQQAKSA
ncbi:MAG: amino acid ABC transporter ATP-binding protein [Gemmataceae bacterium]